MGGMALHLLKAGHTEGRGCASFPAAGRTVRTKTAGCICYIYCMQLTVLAVAVGIKGDASVSRLAPKEEGAA